MCTIITAYQAEATIAAAVRSALAQPQVSEVIVVDDASGDATVERVLEVGATDAVPDGRLKLLRNATNLGPAVGRNRAIAASQAPLIAILDADDYFLPDRFAHLEGVQDWDMQADNIVFVSDTAPPLGPESLPEAQAQSWPLSLKAFVRGNLSDQGRGYRGELGFLKPVMSRAFLDAHGLRYDERLWLGEDFDLYVRMLQCGARFTVTSQCGYVARVRAASLSGAHRTRDLAALITACEGHLERASPADPARPVLQAHLDELRGRYYLRRFLDVKAARGLGAACRYALASRLRAHPILRGLAHDKLWRPLRPPAVVTGPRLLLGGQGPHAQL
ncbi:MAG: glycosyltransferase family 2 protein [Rhodobacteraceae bacterium]|nr:MAG: glycosyltransferase family 2 protein [Paracoccaceae bacterium]